MWVRAVNENDFKDISYWACQRGIALEPSSFFPKHGFIVQAVAAGFIYLTDSNLAIIDCYVANPRSEKSVRNEALDLITRELIKTAKELGYTIIKCDTQIDAVKERAKHHGFKSIGMFESFSMEI